MRRWDTSTRLPRSRVSSSVQSCLPHNVPVIIIILPTKFYDICTLKLYLLCITTGTQQSSIKTEQFIDVQRFFHLRCCCCVPFCCDYASKIGKTNKQSPFPIGAATRTIRRRKSRRRVLSRRRFSLKSTKSAVLVFIASRSGWELRTLRQSTTPNRSQDGGGTSVGGVRGSFYYLFDVFLSYHSLLRHVVFTPRCT